MQTVETLYAQYKLLPIEQLLSKRKNLEKQIEAKKERVKSLYDNGNYKIASVGDKQLDELNMQLEAILKCFGFNNRAALDLSHLEDWRDEKYLKHMR